MPVDGHHHAWYALTPPTAKRARRVTNPLDVGIGGWGRRLDVRADRWAREHLGFGLFGPITHSPSRQLLFLIKGMVGAGVVISLIFLLLGQAEEVPHVLLPMVGGLFGAGFVLVVRILRGRGGSR